MSDCVTGTRQEHAKIDDRMGFLTPILKGFLTEIGVDAANMGIQVREGTIMAYLPPLASRGVVGGTADGETSIRIIYLFSCVVCKLPVA